MHTVDGFPDYWVRLFIFTEFDLELSDLVVDLLNRNFRFNCVLAVVVIFLLIIKFVVVDLCVVGIDIPYINYFRRLEVQIWFHLSFCVFQFSRWIPEVIVRDSCAKTLAERGMKNIKELENSFGRKELPKKVPYVKKCCEVSNANIYLEENSSCLQTIMKKFKLKRIGDKWFAKVTARGPCKEVSNPSSSQINKLVISEYLT